MTTTEFLSCLLKLMGVFLFILFLKNIPEDYSSYLYLNKANGQVFLPAVYATFFKSFVFIGSAVVLFKYPLFIAKKLHPQVSVKPIALKPAELLRPGMILLGIYILSYALPDLIHNAIAVVYLSASQALGFMHMAEALAALLIATVEMIMALYLIINSSGVARLIKQLER